MASSTTYDLLIVGSGPAGATVARQAAGAGLRVLLVDKKQELGAPIQCSGAVSRHALTGNGVEPDEEFIHCPIYGFRIFDVAGRDTTIDYRKLKPEEYGPEAGKVPLGYVVDRRRFDRHLMTLAERAGAEVWLKTEALGYTPNPTGYATVKLRRFGDPLTVKARVVVGADGLQSQVGRWAGLQTHIRINELASCLQFIVDGVEQEPLLEIITGTKWAPGGYAWTFPKGHGYAEIGLGIITTMTDKNARYYLDQLIEKSFVADRFKDLRILEIQGGGVPLAAPLRTQYADNMILVGDAARHVNPITGGGLHTALSGGRIAADFLIQLLAKQTNALTGETLSGYQRQWRAELGDKMWQLYDVKTNIFRQRTEAQIDHDLYETMAGYFSPDSIYKKI